MSKFTPGPWHVSIDPDEPEVVANLCTSGLAHFLIVPSEKNTLGDIAADAKLCAAAPELLAALQRLLPAYRQAVKLYDPNTDDAFTVDAHNAIAKALGGAA